MQQASKSPFGCAERMRVDRSRVDLERVSASNALFGTAESSAPAEVAAKLADVRSLLPRSARSGCRPHAPTGAVAWLTAGLTNRIEAGSTASAHVDRRHARPTRSP